MREFNITGICVPDEHYMVNIEKKLGHIMSLIDGRKYFTINRARQFGKTTTLSLLERHLRNNTEYICINITFENVDIPVFEKSESFCQEFLTQVAEVLDDFDGEFAAEWVNQDIKDLTMLGRHISKLCKGRNIVLLIDEVDQASNNQVFVRFLGMLRSLYLKRANGKANTFHSVILTGVHDVKNIKLKLITAGLHQPSEQEGQYNSPWNIAARFDVDMSFSPSEITTMLIDYENNHNTGMDVGAVSEEIHRFTGGYPYLVSRICKCIDEELNHKDWTTESVSNAVKVVVREKSVLYDDIFKNLENNKGIYEFMYATLILGDKKRLSIFDPIIDMCQMFGFTVVDSVGEVIVANKIFEIIMTDYFISKENTASAVARQVCNGMYRKITEGGRFNMELCLRKFAEHYAETYSSADAEFLERHGRLIFLSFLKPLVNGHGFFHIESQFTDWRRMDVIVDYGQEQFIIELKLWDGKKANEEAYEQLLGYMESKRKNKGYLLTFDFREEKNKTPKSEWVQFGDNQIFDVIV